MLDVKKSARIDCLTSKIDQENAIQKIRNAEYTSTSYDLPFSVLHYDKIFPAHFVKEQNGTYYQRIIMDNGMTWSELVLDGSLFKIKWLDFEIASYDLDKQAFPTHDQVWKHLLKMMKNGFEEEVPLLMKCFDALSPLFKTVWEENSF